MQCIAQCSNNCSWVLEGLYFDCRDVLEWGVINLCAFSTDNLPIENSYLRTARSIAQIILTPLACIAAILVLTNQKEIEGKSITVLGLSDEESQIADRIFPDEVVYSYNQLLFSNKLESCLCISSDAWEELVDHNRVINLRTKREELLTNEEKIVKQKVQKNILQDIQRKISRFSLFRIFGKEAIQNFCEERLANVSNVENTQSLYGENDLVLLHGLIPREMEEVRP